MFVGFLPTLWKTPGMLRSAVALVLPGTAPFELGVVCEVFGNDRSAQGVPAVDFRLVTEHPGIVPTSVGFGLQVADGLGAAEDADLVAVPAYAHAGPDGGLSPAVAAVLRDAVERGAWVVSLCTGAFALAASGLLDGRRCTTHWRHAPDLQRAAPAAVVDADVLYVQDGTVVTSAGTAAGIDACLHIVRTELGAGVAATIARAMVVPPHREGGQAQYIARPVPTCPDDGLGPVLAWALAHLEGDLSVDRLAARARLSPRTFARHFRDTTSATPAAWVNQQRLDRARELLEATDLPVETVARRVGFGSAAVLRSHFARMGTTPGAYRRTFAGTAGGSASV